jgi:hypothetical protein
MVAKGKGKVERQVPGFHPVIWHSKDDNSIQHSSNHRPWLILKADIKREY